MFKVRKRIRRIEYEGIHLVCFGCGVVGHQSDECPRIPPEISPETENNGGEDDDRVVEREAYTRKAQIRKNPIENINGEGIFGPWMLAKNKETRNGKLRQERKDNNEN